MADFDNVDVVVVGTGNAASCAALSAQENGARVVMVDAAPHAARGGNTAYAGGNMRIAFQNVDDLLKIISGLTDEDIANTDFGTYPEDQFLETMGEVTRYRCDPALVEYVVRNSQDTLIWMRGRGVRFQASFGPQSFRVGNKVKFWGNMPCEAWGGGAGLVDGLHAIAQKAGIDIVFDTPAVGLLRDNARIAGVRVLHQGKFIEVPAKAVVLACGGFEANAEMRTRYLGPNWDMAKVRGTRFNTGKGLLMALDAGARSYGHWSGAHATPWDLNAPEFGDAVVRGGYQKHGYPFGIMVNAHGERFFDEGQNFWNLTYVQCGKAVMNQPGMFAWQIFDQKIVPTLRDPYRIRQATRVRANSLEELAGKLEGVDGDRLLRTIADYNAAAPASDGVLDPSILDGCATQGLAIPKTNWARRIEQGPFEAYAVTAGITFTFGGVKITTAAEVEDAGGTPLPGLFAAGEMVGGLFYHNYPGGTGLTCGAVYGRAAGRSAALFAREIDAVN